MTREKRQLIDTIDARIFDALSNLHTSCIAKITAVGTKRISVRPVINRVVNGVSIELPEFVEVPIIWPQGGGSSLTFPLSVDDYCLIVITERCFDNWYEGVDYQSPREFRMHDYSDGFALVGVKQRADELDIPSITTFVGDMLIDGDLEVNGDITANDVTFGIDTPITLSTHIHLAPSGNTGGPLPAP